MQKENGIMHVQKQDVVEEQVLQEIALNVEVSWRIMRPIIIIEAEAMLRPASAQPCATAQQPAKAKVK
jgi:hypothetical protein